MEFPGFLGNDQLKASLSAAVDRQRAAHFLFALRTQRRRKADPGPIAGGGAPVPGPTPAALRPVRPMPEGTCRYPSRFHHRRRPGPKDGLCGNGPPCQRGPVYSPQ